MSTPELYPEGRPPPPVHPESAHLPHSFLPRYVDIRRAPQGPPDRIRLGKRASLRVRGPGPRGHQRPREPPLGTRARPQADQHERRGPRRLPTELQGELPVPPASGPGGRSGHGGQDHPLPVRLQGRLGARRRLRRTNTRDRALPVSRRRGPRMRGGSGRIRWMAAPARDV